MKRPPDPRAFVPPTTAEEADDRCLRLIQEAEDIQHQIQFTNLEEFGDEQGYVRWRRNAHVAMTKKRQEARWLRTWKARLLNSVPWSRSGDSDLVFANQLLMEIYQQLTRPSVTLSEYEQQLMSKVRKHLRRCNEL